MSNYYLADAGIEDRVGDLVTDFIRVSCMNNDGNGENEANEHSSKYRNTNLPSLTDSEVKRKVSDMIQRLGTERIG